MMEEEEKYRAEEMRKHPMRRLLVAAVFTIPLWSVESLFSIPEVVSESPIPSIAKLVVSMVFIVMGIFGVLMVSKITRSSKTVMDAVMIGVARSDVMRTELALATPYFAVPVISSLFSGWASFASLMFGGLWTFWYMYATKICYYDNPVLTFLGIHCYDVVYLSDRGTYWDMTVLTPLDLTDMDRVAMVCIDGEVMAAPVVALEE